MFYSLTLHWMRNDWYAVKCPASGSVIAAGPIDHCLAVMKEYIHSAAPL